MEIITNYTLNNKIKKIEEYKIDLGLAIKVQDSGSKNIKSSGKWIIKDKTIGKYYENFGKYLSRTGKIGTLLFYIDNYLNNNEIYIIHNNEIFISKYDNSPIRNYLSNLIKDVLDNKLKPYIKMEEKEEKIVNLKDMSNEELAEYLSKNR